MTTCPRDTTGRLLLLDAQADTALLFSAPHRTLACSRIDAVTACLEAAEQAAACGHHVAGYLSYEAGYAFEEKLRALAPADPELPLVWFGIYDAPERLGLTAALDLLAAPEARAAAHAAPPAATVDSLDMSERDYEAAFNAVCRHLAKGDIYQANLTMRARGRWSGDLRALFARLVTTQPVGHAAWLDLGTHQVLSLSPELFLERRGTQIVSRPMKGTAPRGFNAQADAEIAAELARDPKSRAENVMIVDLMRNDLSRIAVPGSVQVPRLFEVEPYATLHQMTSTVEAQLEPGHGFAACMARLFPCGSITGAPKLRAMEILHALETGPRGIYTGAIGHLEPGGDFRFNVAIRTMVARTPDDAGEGSFEIGTGSGLVFDSGAGPEYAESRLKLAFLERPLPDFALIETMAWHPLEGYLLLKRHMRRLQESAARLGFTCAPDTIAGALSALAERFEAPRRVRLELSADGRFRLADEALAPTPPRWRIAVSDRPVDAGNPLLAHKTTRRALYDDTLKRMVATRGCDEVLFVNGDGFATEGSYTNLFVARGGRLLTPPLFHGLLPGTLREALLESGRAFEAALTLDDVLAAERVYFGNSVRGLVASDIQSRPS
ncbi:aminodeoxychorismate synthase component I [Stappia stellulata]|uniref:aminodeoxychorismate synthase component I n=1 Tax=Stappia stellulata TaxID=71235 RepID=UPI0003F54830|nr:aminodeoxychorismate synthase component I [Stappia stellulata]